MWFRTRQVNLLLLCISNAPGIKKKARKKKQENLETKLTFGVRKTNKPTKGKKQQLFLMGQKNTTTKKVHIFSVDAFFLAMDKTACVLISNTHSPNCQAGETASKINCVVFYLSLFSLCFFYSCLSVARKKYAGTGILFCIVPLKNASFDRKEL